MKRKINSIRKYEKSRNNKSKKRLKFPKERFSKDKKNNTKMKREKRIHERK